MSEYVIVGLSFEVQTPVYYAVTKAEAIQRKAEAEGKHGIEFRIYRR